MKRKLLTLGLSLCVLTSICVPGTLATKAAEQTESSEPVNDSGSEEAAGIAAETPYMDQEIPETDTEPKTSVQMDDADKTENHKSGMFEQLIACETYEELMEMIEAMSEEEVMQFTSEQAAQIEEKALGLEPQPLPAVIFDETNEEPVASEIIYPTVNFDNVAPFGEPVVG